jgi:hypothetical protein
VLEGEVPHRRRGERGSFGGQLDELIKVFPEEASKDGKNAGTGDRRPGDGGSPIDDRLFESAWGKVRDEDQP